MRYGTAIGLSLLVQVVFMVLPVDHSLAQYASDISSCAIPPGKSAPLLVPKTEDFVVTGTGSHPSWQVMDWQPMTKLDKGGENYESKFKICYSNTGIYVLFSGEDQRITTDYEEDFSELWNGDVFEVFFHPDSVAALSLHRSSAALSYVEYEINALGSELVLFIDRKDGKAQSAYPQRYEGARRITKAVHVAKSLDGRTDQIAGWSAEVYFPFGLLVDGIHTVPGSGTVWHANFCRIDYDTGDQIKWSWTPAIEKSFHELTKFLRIQFE